MFETLATTAMAVTVAFLAATAAIGAAQALPAVQLHDGEAVARPDQPVGADREVAPFRL